MDYLVFLKWAIKTWKEMGDKLRHILLSERCQIEKATYNDDILEKAKSCK